jgi:signal transduction histidine kinase
MYNWYDSREENLVEEIEYVKSMYDTQALKVKQEEYVKNLMFADYVQRVKSNKSRYDYLGSVLKAAQEQIGKKKKKEREQLSTIESFMRDDFLNNDNSFKITKIIIGGYEGYYWSVEFEGRGQTFSITIPVMDNINTKNIQYAYDGMFAFSVKESDSWWTLKKKSYKIKELAEYIKSYFGLDEVNNDEY